MRQLNSRFLNHAAYGRYMTSGKHVIAMAERVGDTNLYIASGRFRVYSRTNRRNGQYSYRSTLAIVREYKGHLQFAFRYY